MRWFKRPSETEASISARLEVDQRLSDVLKPPHIKLNAEGVDRDEIIEELVDLLVQTGEVKERRGAVKALLEREKLGSTGIGRGVAIPHAKHESIERLCAALAVSPRGLDFESVDGKPVRVILLLLSGVDNQGPTLRALAEISHLVHDPHVVGRLLAAKSPAEALDIIRSEE
jgi:mannitol/fructose-specific phosphotransferase system IIA component (Ntr-type)